MARVEETFYKTAVVVGGGVCGTVTTKELFEQNVDCICFELAASQGGVYTRWAYPEMKLTTSTNTTQLSDFPWRDEPKHFIPVEVIKYMEDYCDHFGINDLIRYQTKVNTVKRVHDVPGYPEARWKVSVEQRNWEKHWTQQEMGKEFEVEHVTYDVYCHYVVLACGAHGKGRVPNIPGLEESNINLIHSSEYCQRKEEVRGKRVVQLGLGESGSDIALSIAQISDKMNVSLRRYPYHSGVYFPKFYQGMPADMFDCRVYYGMPRAFVPLTATRMKERFLKNWDDCEYFQRAAYFNDDCGHPEGYARSPLNSFGVKNFNICRAEIDHQAEIKPGIERVEGNTIFYKDGTTFETDAMVFCTGFEPKFEFIVDEKYRSKIQCHEIRNWWKHVVHPDFGDEIFIAGFARPNMTSFFTTIDLTARYIGAVCAGKLEIQPREKMLNTINVDREYYYKNLGYSAQSLPPLVDILYYCDNFAKEMGASPPIAQAFFSGDIKLWLKLLFVSLNSSHYRFTGPNAKWDVARETLVDWTWYWQASVAKKRLASYEEEKAPWVGLNFLHGYGLMHVAFFSMHLCGWLLRPFFGTKFESIGALQYNWVWFWIIWLTSMFFFGMKAFLVPFVLMAVGVILARVESYIQLKNSGSQKEMTVQETSHGIFYAMYHLIFIGTEVGTKFRPKVIKPASETISVESKKKK